MGHEDKVADRDVAEYRRFGVAPSLALGFGTSTRVTFAYFHQTADDIPDYGIPWLFNGPAPVDPLATMASRTPTFCAPTPISVPPKWSVTLSPRVTLRNQVRYSHDLRRAQITEPKVAASVTQATPVSAIEISPQPIGQR